MIKLKRLWYRLLRKTPEDMEMVGYWKTKSSVAAKLMKKDGMTVMQMDGEKYPLNCFPRQHLLFGTLSKLKHEVKNQIFNDSWKLLDEGKPIAERVKKEVLPKLYEILRENKFDLVSPRSMAVPVREIHRAWTKVAPEHGALRDMICFVLQEDDAYRFRAQWIVSYFGWFRWFSPVKALETALTWLEHGEVIGDMKERIRLFRRVILALLQDKGFNEKFTKLFKEIDWSKLKLTKADKYHFRAKYFKVDFDRFDY